MHISRHYHRPIAMIFVLVAFLLAQVFFRPIVYAFEDMLFAVDPSPERAYAYAEKHFSATDARSYDISRAEHFFSEAAALDPLHLSVYHELARVSFLRGDLESALARINFQIAMHGDKVPGSYYVRGLIEGYVGRYDDAARDYEMFLHYQPTNWAALNDYAWVLLKAERFKEAHEAAAQGLDLAPHNPWLLNSDAIALSELGEYKIALARAKAAFVALESVHKKDWLVAYPGNDPRVAERGLASFKKALEENMHTLETKVLVNEVQSN